MLRVLVIDDDDLLRRVLVRGLAGSCDVVAVARHDDVFERLGRGERFDMIMLDLSVTGPVAFVERVRTIAEGQDERIVLFTGVNAADLPADVQASVRGRVLEKPASIAAILSTAQTLRDRHGRPG